MFWDQKEKRIYSDKFTRITNADGVFIGENGFEAEEDLSKWRLNGYSGKVNVTDNPVQETDKLTLTMNQLFYILLTLLMAAFFAGMEIAFFASNKLRLELDRKQGLFSSRIIQYFPGTIGTVYCHHSTGQ